MYDDFSVGWFHFNSGFICYITNAETMHVLMHELEFCSHSVACIQTGTNRIMGIQFTPFNRTTFEPCHEIMALFDLRKLILQTRMRIYLMELDVWFFGRTHTSCVRTAKALARLRGCAGSLEPSLVAYVINTIISWAGDIFHFLEAHIVYFYHTSLLH